MNNKLLETAYKELNKLENAESPTWDLYEQIAMLKTSIDYLEKRVISETQNDSEIKQIIEKAKEAMGAERALDVVVNTFEAFKEDLNYVSPQLVHCFIKKLKENI